MVYRVMIGGGSSCFINGNINLLTFILKISSNLRISKSNKILFVCKLYVEPTIALTTFFCVLKSFQNGF